MLYKSFGIKVPVKIYNKNIKKSVIKNLERYNIEYVYQDKESSRKSGMKDIHIIKINDLQFKIIKTTKMKKIFEVFCEKYGIDVNNISFYLNDIKLNEDDTLKSLGIEDDEIEIYTRSLSSKRSPKTKSSSRTLSRSSPKTKSSSKTRSSPKTKSSSKTRSSPKTRSSSKKK